MVAETSLLDSIQRLVEEIRSHEARRAELVGKIVERGLFSSLKVGVERSVPDEISVCGVDGGMLQMSLSSLDVVAIRAVATVFRYLGGRLVSVDYFPSPLPPVRFYLLKEPLDRIRADMLAGVKRQMLEVACAREAVRRGAAQVILLDGSIVPQYVERFPDSRAYVEQYEEMISLYRALYEEAERAGAFLAGFVKDSRGKRFCEVLAKMPGFDEEERRFLENSRDVAILDALLSENERTVAFQYAEESPPLILCDLKNCAENVHVFYMRTSRFDSPFRVEFLAHGHPEDAADRISSILAFLSSFGFGSSIPPVLVEADFRARLREEAEWIQEKVFDIFGPRFLTRRKRRPL